MMHFNDVRICCGVGDLLCRERAVEFLFEERYHRCAFGPVRKERGTEGKMDEFDRGEKGRHTDRHRRSAAEGHRSLVNRICVTARHDRQSRDHRSNHVTTGPPDRWSRRRIMWSRRRIAARQRGASERAGPTQNNSNPVTATRRRAKSSAHSDSDDC